MSKILIRKGCYKAILEFNYKDNTDNVSFFKNEISKVKNEDWIIRFTSGLVPTEMYRSVPIRVPPEINPKQDRGELELNLKKKWSW